MIKLKNLAFIHNLFMKKKCNCLDNFKNQGEMLQCAKGKSTSINAKISRKLCAKHFTDQKRKSKIFRN